MSRALAAAGLVAAGLLLGPPGAAQEPVTWSSLSGQFGASATRDYFRTSPAPLGVFTLGTRQWVSLGTSGVVFDRRLVNFSVNLRPEWQQIGGTAYGEGGGGAMTGLGWWGSAGVLRNGGPYWLSLSGGRSRVSQRDRVGFETERRVTNLMGRFDLNFSALPAWLQYRRSATADEYGADPAQSWSTRSLQLRAANSKTSLSLERRWHGSGLGPAGGDLLGSAGHRTTWGRGSTWASSLRYTRREDGSGRSEMGWAERISIRQSARVRTDLGFDYAKTGASAATQGLWGAALGVSYPVLARLGGSTRLDSRWTTGARAREHLFTARQALRFSQALPGGGTLAADGSMMFLRDRQSAAGDGWIDVIGERHVAGPDGTFLLDNPAVDAGSLVLQGAGGGIRYQGGLDYETFESGTFTQVVILPGSRIAAQDTVAVDYRFRLAVFGARDHLQAGAQVRATAGPGEAYVAVRRTAQLGDQPEDVTGGFYLYDLDETEYGLVVTGPTPVGRASFGASRLWRRSPGFVFTSSRVSGSLSSRVAPGLSGGVHGAASWSGGPSALTRTVSLGGSMAWRGSGWFSLRGSGGAWWLAGAGPEQRQLSGSLAGNFRLARVNVDVTYQGRMWDTVQRMVNSRLSLSLTRSF